MKKLTDDQLKEMVATIRNGGPEGTGDIIPVLENAINYGDPWRALYIASIEEIKELRMTIINQAKHYSENRKEGDL
jgi:hypothetical protein